MNRITLVIGIFGLSMLMMGCASNERRSNDRTPASNRAGRPYKPAKPMNHRSTTSDSLYQACIRERTEASCRNRLGR